MADAFIIVTGYDIWGGGGGGFPSPQIFFFKFFVPPLANIKILYIKKILEKVCL